MTAPETQHISDHVFAQPGSNRERKELADRVRSTPRAGDPRAATNRAGTLQREIKLAPRITGFHEW